MRSKTVLAVSALFAVVLAAAVLGPSSDVSDAASQRWESSDCSGMSVEYTDGNTYLVIVLDSDPGLGMYDVIVGGKVLKASGSDGKRVGVEMGVALDKSQNYTVIATPNGATYHCTLSYMQFYDVAATADPAVAGSVSGAGGGRKLDPGLGGSCVPGTGRRHSHRLGRCSLGGKEQARRVQGQGIGRIILSFLTTGNDKGAQSSQKDIFQLVHSLGY